MKSVIVSYDMILTLSHVCARNSKTVTHRLIFMPSCVKVVKITCNLAPVPTLYFNFIWVKINLRVIQISKLSIDLDLDHWPWPWLFYFCSTLVTLLHVGFQFKLSMSNNNRNRYFMWRVLFFVCASRAFSDAWPPKSMKLLADPKYVWIPNFVQIG